MCVLQFWEDFLCIFSWTWNQLYKHWALISHNVNKVLFTSVWCLHFFSSTFSTALVVVTFDSFSLAVSVWLAQVNQCSLVAWSPFTGSYTLMRKHVKSDLRFSISDKANLVHRKNVHRHDSTVTTKWLQS